MLTAADVSSMEHAGRALFERGWRKVFTVNEMVDAWRGMVSEVEEGYEDNIYEYLNDIACRRWLELAWPMLTAAARAAYQAEVDDCDERFRAATIEDSSSAIGGPGAGWWERRRPRRLVGELREDLGTSQEQSHGD